MAEKKWYGPELETLPEIELKKVQLEGLKTQVKRVYEKSAYYRKKFDDAGTRPEDIQTLDDIRKLPLTRYTTDMLPEDVLTIPIKKAPFIMSSGGTTGSPKPFYMSKKDIENWGSILGRLAEMHSIGDGDILHVGFPWIHPFEGFVAAGARYIPFYHTMFFLDNEVRMMERMKVTAFFGGAAQFMNIFRRATEMGINLGKMGLRVALFSGETWPESYRHKIEQESGVKLCDYYGLMEIGPIAAECAERNGLHVWEDINIVEIIDPDSGETLPQGETGEIVVTPLWREAMPFLRYRTGDVATYWGYQECPCGRTFPKMSRVRGRADHMIRVKEVKLFPMDVEEAIYALPELGGEYQIIIEKNGILDTLKVKAECNSGVSPTFKLRAKLEEELKKTTKADSEVELVPYGEIPRSATFKAQRLVKTY